MNTPNPHPVVPWLTPQRRAWIYRVAVACLLLAGGYGLLADEHAGLWVGLGAALLSSGTAALHTPTGDHGDRGQSTVVVALLVAILVVLVVALL